MKNKTLTIQATLILSFLVLNTLSFQNLAFSTPKQLNSSDKKRNFSETKWKAVSLSLTDFLNDGWKLVGQSSHRVATVTSGGFGAIDETTYAYTLSKDGKYVTCVVIAPKPDGVSYSGCRSLN